MEIDEFLDMLEQQREQALDEDVTSYWAEEMGNGPSEYAPLNFNDD